MTIKLSTPSTDIEIGEPYIGRDKHGREIKMNRVAVWPNGAWCFEHTIGEHIASRGNGFELVALPAEGLDIELGEFIVQHLAKR